MQKSEIKEGHVVVDIKPNCKSVNIDFDKRTVVMEYGADWSSAPEPKFKKGDFVFSAGSVGYSFLIYSGVDKNVIFQVFYDSGNVYWTGSTESDFVRLMTDSEKQILLDKLHEAGKDWDEEKCEIVDWVWKPKFREGYYLIGAYGVTSSVWTDDNIDYNRLDNGFVFRTEKIAEAALKLLKQAKHY